MLNLVLFGPPGAGKGTQAEKIIEKYALKHFSTGDMLRKEIADKTDLGMQAKAFMEKGELVTDELVINIINSVIERNKEANGFIFDGFPRTQAQAKALDELLQKLNIPICAMISLEVEKQELVDRLVNRGKLSGRPDDSNIDVIENRIQVYNNQTAPLIEYYKAQNKHRGIYGMGTIEEIFDRICVEIEKVK